MDDSQTFCNRNRIESFSFCPSDIFINNNNDNIVPQHYHQHTLTLHNSRLVSISCYIAIHCYLSDQSDPPLAGRPVS